MHDKTLTQLKAGLDAGDFSARELTEHLLARIEQLDPRLNSFVTRTAEQARAQVLARGAHDEERVEQAASRTSATYSTTYLAADSEKAVSPQWHR